ncbi:condensin-2 complex subunit H2 [Achlya hypogyna]|uniref:Condensin-2 complex subunit H2 n=1 Tax=Achlya hypogyna TaxID=1202772 RepID=A0A1V9YAY7_ACHHY|nr:condensin-2 complex subunit H2 [Achlya hypogyna]
MAAAASAAANLLEPIRDLGWQLDLAAELEEYLQAIQADESDLVNFAQAALLVQNSTVRYSKKVENLYALVLESLTHLQANPEKPHTSKRQRTAHGSAARGSFDGTVLATSDFESHASSLDAPVNWTFHKRVEESDKIYLLPNTQLLHATAKRITTKTFQASMALMGSLVPDDRETGESFKLRSCTMHSKSGALLLDDCSKLLLDPEADVTTVELPAEALFRRATLGNISEGDEGVDDTVASVEFATDANDTNEPDYDMGGGGFDPETPVKQDALVLPDVDVPSCDEPLPAYDIVLDDVKKQEVVVAKSKADPWLQLDPYDASHSVSQPFVKGVTYTTPKPARAKKLVKDEPLYDPSAKRVARTTERLKRHLATKPMALFATLDCDAVPFRQLHLQYALALERTEAKSTVKTEPAFVPADDVGPTKEQDDPFPVDNDYAFGGGASDSDQEDEIPAYEKQETFDEPAPFEPPPKQLEPTDDTSYEELCKQHIENFMQGSEHFKKQTTLTRKVAEWQRSLTPLLVAQEERPPFDIHACGDAIVERLVPEASKPFGAVVDGMSVYEVCRMFSAALQLANAGSVELAHGDEIDSLEIVRT